MSSIQATRPSMWKEQLLYREGGRAEASILMIGTPESLIAEGIADWPRRWCWRTRTPSRPRCSAGTGSITTPTSREPWRACRPPRASDNAAIMLYEDDASEDEAVEYLKDRALMSDRRARQAMKFIADPMALVRTTYEDGRGLRTWVDGDRARFKRLLTEQLTPADSGSRRPDHDHAVDLLRDEREALVGEPGLDLDDQPVAVALVASLRGTRRGRSPPRSTRSRAP